MTTHNDAAARIVVMHEYVEYKPDMAPLIYRLAGVAQALCRGWKGQAGTAEHTHVRHVEVHERRPEVYSLTHEDSTDRRDLSVRARLGLHA